MRRLISLISFFSQLLGVAIRADVPVTLDFLPCFWKSLKGEPLSLVDLKEADYVTYNLTRNIMNVQSPQELEEVVHTLGHICEPGGEEKEVPLPTSSGKKLRFVYTTLNGIETELIPGGKDIVVE